MPDAGGKFQWKRIRIALYFLGACVLLYFLVPRQQRFFYEYQRGKAWNYPPLTAPFDYPIRKSSQELRKEERALEQKVRPIFVEDTSVVGRVVADLLGDVRSRYATYIDSLATLSQRRVYDSLVRPTHDSLEERLFAVIHYLYKVGVIETQEVLNSTSSAEFSVLRNRIAYQTALTDVYSPHTASAYISRALSRFEVTRTEAAFWRQINFVRLLEPNLRYDSILSAQVREEAANEIARFQGIVKTGERVVNTGELVTEDVYLKIESLRQEMDGAQRHGLQRVLAELGYFFLFLATFGVLYLFLYSNYPELLVRERASLFLLLLCAVMLGVGLLVVRFAPSFLYLVPLILVPFLVRTFFDARISLVTHLLVVVTLAFFASDSYTFTVLHGVAGIVAVLGTKSITRRGHLFHRVLLVLLTYVLLYSIITVLQGGGFSTLNLRVLALFAGNALLTLASYQFSYPLERTFGFVSNVTLLELCDTNHPLLRELLSQAPGTFQHCMQVANLAETAAVAIGANALLVRAGALYHDVGKMLNPAYFVENQSEGMTPHAHLTELESVKVIHQHVIDGISLAHRYKLPTQIQDFIRTHHGTTRTEYFYRTYLAAHPEENAAEVAKIFTYPGPRPFSRETAILMMADSIEAASRTLKVFTVESLTQLVEGIVSHQQNALQFDNSNLTLRDIAIAKREFVAKLKNFYHSRIEYPPNPEEGKQGESTTNH